MFLPMPGAHDSVNTHRVGQADEPVKADVSHPGER
jgi:hypothetical protein